MYGPTLQSGTSKDGRPIVLAPLDPKYVDTVVSWLNDPDVMQHLNPAWEKTTREKELRTFKEFQTASDCIYWIITVDNAPVGVAWLNEIDPKARSGALGIMIGDKTLWGQGVGTAVGSTICTDAFSSGSFDTIHIAFTEENKGSQQIALRLGFTLTHGIAHFTEGKEYPGWDGVLHSGQE